MPSSTVAPPELARTGINGSLAVLGLILLVAGAFIHISRMGVRRGNH